MAFLGHNPWLCLEYSDLWERGLTFIQWLSSNNAGSGGFNDLLLICLYNIFPRVYLVKYHYTHDNSDVNYTYECSLAHNCKQNIKLLPEVGIESQIWIPQLATAKLGGPVSATATSATSPRFGFRNSAAWRKTSFNQRQMRYGGAFVFIVLFSKTQG